MEDNFGGQQCQLSEVDEGVGSDIGCEDRDVVGEHGRLSSENESEGGMEVDPHRVVIWNNAYDNSGMVNNDEGQEEDNNTDLADTGYNNVGTGYDGRGCTDSGDGARYDDDDYDDGYE
jgi:hypothetical protein